MWIIDVKSNGYNIVMSRGGDSVVHVCEECFFFFFFCFVALRPKSTAMVIAGRSVHLTTLFPGQA